MALQFRTQKEIMDQILAQYNELFGHNPDAIMTKTYELIAESTYTLLEQQAATIYAGADIFYSTGLRTDELCSYSGLRRIRGKQVFFDSVVSIVATTTTTVFIPKYTLWNVTDTNGITTTVQNADDINIPIDTGSNVLYGFSFFYSLDNITLDVSLLNGQVITPIDPAIATLLSTNTIKYTFDIIINNGFVREEDLSLQSRVFVRNNMVSRIDKYREEVLKDNKIRFLKIIQNRDVVGGLTVPPFSSALPINNVLIITDREEVFDPLTDDPNSRMGYIFYSMIGEGTTWLPSDSGYETQKYNYDVIYDDYNKWNFKYITVTEIPLVFKINYEIGTLTISDQAIITQIISNYPKDINQVISSGDFSVWIEQNNPEYAKVLGSILFKRKDDDTGPYVDIYRGGVLDIFVIQNGADIVYTPV